MNSGEIYKTIRKIEVCMIDGRKKIIYPNSEPEQIRTVDYLKEAIRKGSIFEYDDTIIVGKYIQDIETSTQRVRVPNPN
ncbi:hypothetical protein D3C73_767530 [compost metagenome]